MTIRVGIIGAGHWHAERYLAALLDIGVEIVGVSDGNLEVAGRVSDRVGGTAFADYREMLESRSIDFVLSMTPHDEAAEVTRELIRHRLPAIVEKPGGLRASDIAPLVEGAREERLHISVPFVNRYSALFKHADRPADEPVHGAFRIVNGPPTRYAQAGCAWMLDPARSGGGALRNLGIHAADAALTLLAGERDDYALDGCNLTFHDDFAVETHGQALVTFAPGATAVIEAGYTYPMVAAGMTHGGDYEWRLVTRGGYLLERDDVVRVASAAGESEQPTMPDAERYRRFVHDTLDHWRAGEPPVADLEDCRRAALLIDRIYDTAGVPWAANPAPADAKQTDGEDLR